MFTACVRSVKTLFILSTSPIIYKFLSKLTKSFCYAQFTHTELFQAKFRSFTDNPKKEIPVISQLETN